MLDTFGTAAPQDKICCNKSCLALLFHAVSVTLPDDSVSDALAKAH